MNPEIIRAVPRKLITHPEVLGRVCWNLTNRLTGGRWINDDMREAQLSRAVSDLIGMQRTMTDTDVAPVTNDIGIGFYARKKIVEGVRDHYADIDQYKLSMTVGQTINHDEIPANVLEEIFDIYEIGQDFDEDDDDEEGDVRPDAKSVEEIIEAGALEDIEIVRQQKIKYKIIGTGEIAKYSLSFSYFFGGQKMYETRYRSDEDTRGMSPIIVGEQDEVVEKRPLDLVLLNEHNIESEISEMDTELTNFVENMPLRELVALSAKSQQEHRQQALAILGMLTSGMYGLHSLATRS
jgi:hypothetical protein